MIEINLLPGSRATRARALPSLDASALVSSLSARFTDRYLIGAIAAVTVALVAVGGMYLTQRNHEIDVQSHYDEVVRDSIKFATVLEARRRAEIERDSVYQQLAIIKSIDDTRYTWPHLLQEINSALPIYTWLTSVTQTSPITTTAAIVADSGHATPDKKTDKKGKGASEKANTQANAKARRARADSLYNGQSSTTKFRIVGQTVDIQALTLFMKNLEASPFIKNVQLARSDLVVTDSKEVTEFQLEAETEMPSQLALNTIPLSVVVH